LDFSQLLVGTSATKSLTLTNTGTASLVVSGVALSGPDAANFTDNFSGPITLNPGTSTTFNVTFTPTATGAKSATLILTHDGTNSPVNVALTGQGVAAPLRLNAGGPQVTTGGVSWSADQYFSGTTNTYSAPIAIAGTTDAVLYQTERYGNSFTYSIPVPSGTYTVKLHFAEIYWTAAGKRIFSANVENGQGLLTNYDIFAKAGHATAVVESFPNVSVTDGFLTIAFTTQLDNAKISAIEIIGSPPVITTCFVLNSTTRRAISFTGTSSPSGFQLA
jgi:hypothetical protein